MDNDEDEQQEEAGSTAIERWQESFSRDEQQKQSTPPELLREFLANDDPISRLRSVMKLFEVLLSMAVAKSDKVLQYFRAEGVARDILRLIARPVIVVMVKVRDHFDRIQATNVGLPPLITYPEPVQNCSSFDSVYELNNPSEPAVYKQWQMAPIEMAKRRAVVNVPVKCKKNTAKIPNVRSGSRAQQWASSSDNFGHFSAMDDEDAENELDDSDQYSLPSSTTGISTMNNDDKARINHLEAQLAQLQGQMNLILNNQNKPVADDKAYAADLLPSICSSASSSEPSPEQRKKYVPPPPAPPPPPVDFLRPKPVPPIKKLKVEPKNSEPINGADPRGRLLMNDVLKGLGNVNLRKVEKSPNGTPMRGSYAKPWPTFPRRKNAPELPQDDENRAPFDKNSSNAGTFIAQALREKFASLRMSDNFIEADDEEEEASNHSGWDDDQSFANQFKQQY